MNSASGFVDATGVIETEGNSCWDPRGTRVNSREQVTPDDVTFWVNKVLAPKYGIDNLNANNASSFLKEFEVNWVKLPTELKNKVMDLLVEQILSQNYDFKQALMDRMNLVDASTVATDESTTGEVNMVGKEAFGLSYDKDGVTYSWMEISILAIVLIVVGVIIGKILV